jgi:hypothetical protein
MNGDIRVITFNEYDRLSDEQVKSLGREVAKWDSFKVPRTTVAVQNRCATAVSLFSEALGYKSGEDYGNDWIREHLAHKSLRLYKSNRGIESGIYYDIDKDKGILNIMELFSAPWNQDKFETRIEGMAKRMLYDVFKIALSKGCNKAKVNAVPYSGSFYTRLGFTKGKKNEDGRDMLLRLKGMEDFVKGYREKDDNEVGIVTINPLCVSKNRSQLHHKIKLTNVQSLARI